MKERGVLWCFFLIIVVVVGAIYNIAKEESPQIQHESHQIEVQPIIQPEVAQSPSHGASSLIVPGTEKGGRILLTQEEATRLSSWMKAHGYLFDVSNGGRTGYSSATGYEAMESKPLRQLAASGDQIAALTLGLRLVQREDSSQRFAPSPNLEEGKNLLLQASVFGYTASLDALAELALEQASSGRELRRGEKFVPEYMVEAYAYAYLIQERGSLNSDITMDLVRKRGALNQEQESEARRMASAIYDDLSRRRMAAGLPGFVNGVPPDIRGLSDRAVAIQLEQR